jgi:protein-S-isoprenylcysteine O-methyltransferase Ste14
MASEPRGAQAAGAPIPPPVLVVAAILGGFALRRLVAFPIPIPLLPAWIGGALLIAAGTALALAAMGALVRGGTTPFPHQRSNALVVEGAYRISRNPIYLSMAVVLTGVAVAARSGWHLVMLVLLVAVFDRTQIPREERYLEARFGDSYRRYARRVRRWF